VGRTKDIREAVAAELNFDPLIDPAHIAVRNMNGQVALNGTVPSYPQYLEAATAAQRVAGVTDVHNHLEVVLPDRDYRDDAMLTTAANNALTLNITVPDGVEAIARDGNLTLTGVVNNGAQRAVVHHQRHRARPGRAGPVRADSRRQRHQRGHQREHRDTGRPRPHLGRTRRGRRCRVDDQGRLRSQRRHLRHRLTIWPALGGAGYISIGGRF